MLRHTARRCLYTSAAAILAAVSGCAQSRPATPASSAGTTASPLDNLARAAEREIQHPVAAAMNAPPPESVEPILSQAIRPDDTSARINFDEARARFIVKSEPAAAPVADDDTRREALRHYVLGREKLLSGEPASAIDELRQATQLDPGAGEPWRELGEAQLAAGLRTEALSSFRAAVAAGLNEPRTLEFLGRAALERADYTEATKLLCAALSANPDRVDPALERLILVELARALAPQGYIVAAKESLERALRSPAQLSASTRYAAELGALFRRQGDLWRDVGDAECRLGNYDEAIDSYRRALELPSIDNKPLRPRIVFACMRAGRPSAAAAAVLEDISGARGRVSSTDLSLLQYIASHAGNARQISELLGVMRTPQGGPLPPTLDRDLSLAQAGILPRDQALPLLREHVTRHPSDLRAAIQLIGNAADAASAAAEATRITASRPAAARTLAEALLQSRHDLSAVFATLERASPRLAARLLAAAMIAKQGRPGEALAITASITGTDTIALAAASASVENGLDSGNPAAADAAIERIRRSRADGAAMVLARCLLLTQRYSQALDTIRPELAAPNSADRIDRLLLAGDIATRLGRADEAERWISEAAALDHFDDRAPSLLLALYSASGPKADGAKLTQLIRDLRQDNPDSRTLRMLRAREMMRRSQWTPAEAELTALADEDPGDPAPLELLLNTWQERFKTDPGASTRAEQWLRSHLERRPQSPLLLAGLTAIQISQGHAAEAEAPLRDAIAKGASPDASRVLERLLRDSLSRAADADALARARLDNRPLTIAESIELATLYARAKEFDKAVLSLRSSLPGDIELTRDQATQVLSLLNDASGPMVDAKNSAALSAIASLFDRCMIASATFTADLHVKRLIAMAASPDFSAEQLLDAAKKCIADFPALKTRPYIIVTQVLVAAGRGNVAPDFIARAAASTSLADTDLYQQWYIVIVRFGTAADAKIMIDSVHAAGRLKSLLDRINTAEEVTTEDLRAQAAYILGNLFSQVNRKDQADAAYELSLSYDPKHAWSSNNLGYSLADRGVDLERASALLEHALERLPEETPVIDSLGWLRYKQGIIADITDPDTGLTKRRGAIYYLQKAANTPRGMEDPTILDHFGDALWLAGRPEDAMKYWDMTSTICRAIVQRDAALRQAAADDAAPDAVEPQETADVIEARKLIESVRIKRSAAASGEVVHVAPQIANPDPQPAKIPARPVQQAAPQPAPDRGRPD